MKKSTLFFLIVFSLLILSSIGYTETAIEFLFANKQLVFMETHKRFSGEGGTFYTMSEKSLFSISIQFVKKEGRNEVEETLKRHAHIEFEAVVWKSFVGGLAINYLEEEIVFNFLYQPNNIMVENWKRNQYTAGLGYKLGGYNERFFIRIMMFGGRSNSRVVEELDFLGITRKNFANENVFSLNTRGMWEVIFLPICIDFQADYRYFAKRKKYRPKLELGLYLKLLKKVGIRIAASGFQSESTNEWKINYSAGVVGIF